ncbi:TraR/DksA family transcriptional regulator [Streptomyces bohaiensis]|uniref:TraR/DksA family transcriptional regulator n=1 Tax=Streptomyces bohaiensis TaxID=1431344 RepID=UPI0030C6ED2A
MVANDDPAARRAVAKKAAKKASGTGRPVASAAGSATAAERSQARRATARAAADHDQAPRSGADGPGTPDGRGTADATGAATDAGRGEGGNAPAGRATRKAAAKRTAGRQTAARGTAARGAAPGSEHAREPSGKPVTKAVKGAAEKAAAGRAPARAPGGATTRRAVGRAGGRGTGPDGGAASAEDSGTTRRRAADGAPDEETGAEQVAAEKTTVPGSDEPAPEGPIDPAALAVRPGEDPWTAEEVEEARAELTADARRLRDEIDATQQALTGLMRDSGDGAGDDQADLGTKNVTREHEMALAGNSREMLRQTRRALARLEAGTYGVCENCGEPIGKARMQAFPRATLCVACKQRLERRL